MIVLKDLLKKMINVLKKKKITIKFLYLQIKTAFLLNNDINSNLKVAKDKKYSSIVLTHPVKSIIRTSLYMS